MIFEISNFTLDDGEYEQPNEQSNESAEHEPDDGQSDANVDAVQSATANDEPNDAQSATTASKSNDGSTAGIFSFLSTKKLDLVIANDCTDEHTAAGTPRR